MLGYSDRINHALAFAAKHHDQLVRRGTRLPYFAQPANLAIILTRYQQSEDVVLAGILHDVVSEGTREGLSSDVLRARVADKFGPAVLDILLPVVPRRTDQDGMDFSLDERRSDLLDRLAAAPDESRWVCAAEKLHGAASIAADVRRTVDPATVWSRLPGGAAPTARWFRQVTQRYRDLGFDAPIVHELDQATTDLEQLAGEPGALQLP